jgi:hypothetical protein
MKLARNDSGTFYEIQVQGELDRGWEEWFDGFSVSVQHASKQSRTTTFLGPVADQSALRGILGKLWDLNLTLISVRRIEKGEYDVQDASNL